jgi:hypothetical protein
MRVRKKREGVKRRIGSSKNKRAGIGSAHPELKTT